MTSDHSPAGTDNVLTDLGFDDALKLLLIACYNDRLITASIARAIGFFVAEATLQALDRALPKAELQAPERDLLALQEVPDPVAPEAVDTTPIVVAMPGQSNASIRGTAGITACSSHSR